MTSLFRDRFDQLRHFLAARAANLTLNRMLQRCANKVEGAIAPAITQAEDLAALERCVAQGATAHLRPGALDGVALMPQLATAMMAHGARPTTAFVDQIEAWCDRKDRWNPRGSHWQDPREALIQLQAAVFKAVELDPALDWNRLRPRSEFYPNGRVLSHVMETTFKGMAMLVSLCRSAKHVLPGPLHASADDYTRLLLGVFAPPWQVGERAGLHWEYHDLPWVVPGLIAQGADPNACADLRNRARVPLLALAMLYEPDAVPILLAHGAQVDARVITHMLWIVCDEEFRQFRRHSGEQEAFAATMAQYAPALDWDMIIPSNDRFLPTFRQQVERRFPDLIEDLIALEIRKRAACELDAMETATPAPIPAVVSQRGRGLRL